MARVTLSPVNFPGSAGITLPATGAQSMSGFTGVQFINNGTMVLAVYIGSSGAGNVTQNFGRTIESQLPAPIVVAVIASTNYIFGPWSPSDFTAQDGTGLTYIDFSGTQTLNSVTLYQLSPRT